MLVQDIDHYLILFTIPACTYIHTSTYTYGIQVVEEVYARSGIKGFFAGVQYAAIQSAIEKSVYFYAYSIMKVGRVGR